MSYVNYARGAGLTREQAAKMADGYLKLMESQIAQAVEKAKEQAKGLSNELVGEFGSAANEYYRKATGNGLMQTLARYGLGGNKEIARAMVLLGGD